MAIALTADPIVTVQECKDVLGMNDETKTIVLINSVSAKFLKYTNRVRINKGQVMETTQAVDGRLVWAHAPPISQDQEVRIQILDQYQIVKESYSSESGELVVDWLRGRVARPNCTPFPNFCGCGNAAPADGIPTPETGRGGGASGFTFPNLELSYIGGWETLPGDLVMSAFEQIKMDLERLKGNTGITAASGLSEQVAFETEDISKSVLSIWKRYRVLV